MHVSPGTYRNELMNMRISRSQAREVYQSIMVTIFLREGIKNLVAHQFS